MRLRQVAVLWTVLTMAGAAFAQQATIFVVRHAEKVSETSDALSDTGKARAQCLAATLKDVKIDSVLTSDTKRAQQTAAPTAAEQKVEITALAATNTAAVVEEARRRARDGRVLIVGHSNTVPLIVKALTGKDVTVGSTQYDQLFVIEGSDVVQLHYCPAAEPGPESRMK